MENIDLNQLRVFNKVVTSGSFSKAATLLKQPKSRVSRNILALERDLGVQLIYRTTRQFKLTEAGKDLFEKTNPALNGLYNSLDEVGVDSAEVSGLIKVTVPEDLGSELIGGFGLEFAQEHPKVQLMIHASNQYVDLVKDSIDLAVRIGKIKDSSMLVRKVGEVERVFVVSADLFRKHPFKKINELDKIPFLSAALTGVRGNVKINKGQEVKELIPSTNFMSNNHFILRTMALGGHGVALIPKFLVTEAINRGELIQVYKDWKIDSVPIQILIPHQKEVPRKIRKLSEFLILKLAKYF